MYSELEEKAYELYDKYVKSHFNYLNPNHISLFVQHKEYHIPYYIEAEKILRKENLKA